MELAAPSAADQALSSTLSPSADRRRHKRVAVTLLGRFMRANKQEYPCKLLNISVGGAALMSPVDVDPAERIVAYFDHIAGIEGLVARTFEGGFAVQIFATQHKREKLAAQFTWLINRHELVLEELRRHDRQVFDTKAATLKFDDGAATTVDVTDMSISGASVITETRPRVGSEVCLGKLRGRVIRHHADGIAVEFIDIQRPDALRRYFR